ncbi:MAG: GxxExxY protein [Bacteroidales bacterium]|nr:GxxExxY protein [Bacteroidales bacterium]
MTNKVKTNDVIYKIIGGAMEVYNQLGPGLLESVYHKALNYELNQRGLFVQSEIPVEVLYKGVNVSNDLKVDLLVDNLVVVELKSVEYLLPVHFKQLRTYMKLLNLSAGVLINFDVGDFKNGYRVVKC